MKIQSISVVVPTRKCINKCPFCVSRMHDNEYENDFDANAYKKRLKYAAMNGVTTLILTGTGEAMQNTRFLINLESVLNELGDPFPHIELQTTGVFLNKRQSVIDADGGHLHYDYSNLRFLKSMGVDTISLSISDIFDEKNNLKILGTPDKYKFSLHEITHELKRMGFTIRISLNLLNVYNSISPSDIIRKCKDLKANQITFRILPQFVF